MSLSRFAYISAILLFASAADGQVVPPPAENSATIKQHSSVPEELKGFSDATVAARLDADNRFSVGPLGVTISDPELRRISISSDPQFFESDCLRLYDAAGSRIPLPDKGELPSSGYVAIGNGHQIVILDLDHGTQASLIYFGRAIPKDQASQWSYLGVSLDWANINRRISDLQSVANESESVSHELKSLLAIQAGIFPAFFKGERLRLSDRHWIRNRDHALVKREEGTEIIEDMGKNSIRVFDRQRNHILPGPDYEMNSKTLVLVKRGDLLLLFSPQCTGTDRGVFQVIEPSNNDH